MRYRALALQTTCHSVAGLATVGEARAAMDQAVTRIGAQVRASKAFVGPDVRLVVLPEYALTGFPMGNPPQDWIDRACVGPEDDTWTALGDVARSAEVHLAINLYETDAAFPGVYFQACAIIDPSGERILTYRRLNSLYAPTPHDLWTDYLDVHGPESIFPVVTTEIGCLAPIASEEVRYPELVRAFVLRGAEVLCHSTSETGSPHPTPKSIARQARASENMAYVISANSAGVTGTAIPAASTDGGSVVVGFDGSVLAQAGPGESMVANADIDLAALRAARARPGMDNVLSRLRPEVIELAYAGMRGWPADTLLSEPFTSPAVLRGIQRDVLDAGQPQGPSS